ncbi:MAG: DUF4286 family protein [Bacteroidia bacterium]|nr:DUF4286 family protein [Bacteroidia bacterium]
MIVYSVTITLAQKDGHDWERYMMDKHMDDVVNTGCFAFANLRKVLNEGEEEVSYVGEYFAPNQASLDIYYRDYADEMRKDANSRFAGKIKASRKVYELIEK